MQSYNVLVMISPLSPERLNGIARFAREHNWHMMSTDRLLHRLSGWRGDGAIVTLRNDPLQLKTVRGLLKKGIPVVDLTCEHPEIDLPRVIGDHVEIGRLAGHHFLERRFAHVAWFSTAYTHVHRLREQGVRTAGLSEPLIRLVVSETLGERKRDDWNILSRWLGRELVRAPKPLGVVCYDDTDAARVADVCQACRLSVPEEVSILGIGNDTFICGYQSVPISSVIHDTEETGYRGAAILQRLMGGQKPPKHPVLIPPKGLVVRASTDVVAVSDPTIRQALLYIRSHLDRSFGIAQIAEALHTTPITLHRLFHRHLGCRVGDEIRRERLARAKLMLENTSLNLSEIAKSTGFCNAAHFSRTFRSQLGINPSKWKASRNPTSASPPGDSCCAGGHKG